jgi:hypothetical protein
MPTGTIVVAGCGMVIFAPLGKDSRKKPGFELDVPTKPRIIAIERTR